MKKLLPFTLLTILLSLSSYSGFGQCKQALIDRTGSIKKDTLIRCIWTGLESEYYQNYTYQWFYEDNLIGTTSYINTNKDGWYKLSIKNGSCQSSDSVFVVLLKVDMGPTYQTYCGFEKEIIIQNKSNYNSIEYFIKNTWWYPDAKISLNGNSIKMHPQIGEYMLIIESTSNICTKEDTVFLNPDPNCTAWTTLKGKVFRDLNKNGVFDTDEKPLTNTKVLVGDYTTFTDKDGNYTIYLPIGDYTVTIPEIIYQEAIVPAAGIYDLSITKDTTLIDKDFAFYWDNTHDLSVTVSGSRSRPGLDHTIFVTAENKGDINETYHAIGSTNTEFEFQNASNGGYFDESCNCVKWDNLTLDEGKKQTLSANFFVPINTTMGTSVMDSAAVTSLQGDINLANNLDIQYSQVVNSFDPNDKLVSATPFRSDKGIDADSKLTYTVRFQNTGTDTAYHVVVKDTLSPNLDLNTLQFLGASHPYTLEIDNYRVLTVRFANIMLPDSIINEPKSHGYLKFNIYPVQNASEGTVIENKAGIYFDYNSPVITNTTQSIISEEQLTLTQGAVTFKKNFKVFPNPANDIINVENEIEPILSLELLDLSGKKILQTSQSELNIQNIPSGIYQLKMQTASGIWFKKVVVE